MTSTTDPPFTAANPVSDRFAPPPCGELDGIADVLLGGQLSGGAQILQLYERALADWFGVRHAIAVNSGTSALHAVLTALGVGPGDEVLVPATAPLPTAMPVLTCGATPVIVDTAPWSLALDPGDVQRKLTRRTRVAMSLPLWGYPCDDTPAAELLASAGVAVIDDACQAHGTTIAGRYAGTGHRAGCFSTHDRKLLSTGEGGFVLTDDADLADRIDYYTHLGHLRGQVHGVNYKLAAPLAAIGLRRLADLSNQIRLRRDNASRLLTALPPGGQVTELPYRADDEPNYYTLVLLSPGAAPAMASQLADGGLPPDSVRYGYGPLYRQPIFASYATTCPNAEAMCAAALQFPVHPAMTSTALQWVADRFSDLA
jgi:perosamine synthetase